MEDSEAICPTVEYSDLKKDPQNFVEVRVEIKGLEKKMLSKTSNAIINFDMTERSFVLTAEVNPLKGSSKFPKYRYEVKQLPAEIDPTKSSYEVQKGKIILKLKKASPAPWARQLAAIGLDHAPEES